MNAPHPEEPEGIFIPRSYFIFSIAETRNNKVTYMQFSDYGRKGFRPFAYISDSLFYGKSTFPVSVAKYCYIFKDNIGWYFP